MGFPKDYSSISAPLKIGNTTLGLLTLAHNTSSRYGPEAKEMTMTFANYAAIAIHNSRLFLNPRNRHGYQQFCYK